MIKKLRIKFIIIIMCMITVVLAVAFGAIMYSTTLSLQNDTEDLLSIAMKNNRIPKEHNGSRRAFGVITIDETGAASLQRGNLLLVIDEKAIAEIAQDVASRVEKEGEISEYNLRYLREETESGWKIALVDNAQEMQTRNTILRNCLLIGLVSLAVFFVISLALSRWATKPLADAWQQNRAFVSDASHELKTPLTVILSNAEMLRGRIDESDEKSVRWCGSIQAEAARMRKLTEELLELAKLDEKVDKKMIAAPVDLSYLLMDVVLTYEPRAFEAGKSIRFENNAEVTVQGDAEMLRRICVILVDNAIKYSPEGGVVEVELTANGVARIDISNAGEEIPPEEAELIFSRFYRTDKARTYNGGHGLGLAIAANIVYMHNGKIWVKSKGGINTFSISLPVSKS